MATSQVVMGSAARAASGCVAGGQLGMQLRKECTNCGQPQSAFLGTQMRTKQLTAVKPAGRAGQSMRAAMSAVAPSTASSIPESISDGAERLIGGHVAKNKQEKEEFLHIAQDVNKKIPGLVDSVWGQKGQGPKYPALDKDLICDVCVIGAGIAGLSIAYNLAKAGKKVVVLEGKSRGSGQTGKTTAHVMLWNDDYYHMIEKIWGTEAMKKVGEAHREAAAWISKTLEEEGIDASYVKLDGYLCAKDEGPETQELLRKEADAARRAGFQDAEIVDLKGDSRHGSYHQALKFPGSGEIQPLQYINGLADTIVDKYGAKIYEQTRVIQIDGDKVHTRNGHVVNADAIVYATNTNINRNQTIHSRQSVSRSYVTGIKVPKDSIEKAVWWDTQVPTYHYVRLESFDDYDVLVVGGEDHNVGQHPDEYYDPYERLESYARARWPAAKDGDVLYRWSGTLYKPDDLLHLHGREPLDLSGHKYVATGDSGQGMTGGTIAGLVISSLILNGDHKWADVFNPSRLPPLNDSVTVGRLANEVKTTVQGLVENVTPKKLKHVKDVLPGTGAIIQDGIKQAAVFRDKDTGKAHVFTALCPHLKCEVQWNPNDMTFDCPCHGSEFDRYGRVIQGPGREDLEPLEL